MNLIKFILFLALTILSLLVSVTSLTSCSAYSKSVDSRTLGLQGSIDQNGGSGKLIYTVHYR